MTVETDQEKTIFDNSTDEVETKVEDKVVDQPQEEPNEPDPVATLLAEIKREDGTQKYSDISSALNALMESQSFIETLKADNTSLKEKLELYKDKAERNITMEDILNSVKTAKNEGDEQPSNQPDPQSMEALINTVIEQRENTKTVSQNLKIVDEAIRAKFNDNTKAAEFLKTRASEIGIGVDFLKDVAGRSPQAAIKLLGLEDKKTTVGEDDVPSSVSTERWKPATTTNKPRSAMFGGSSKDVLDSWNRAKQNIPN